MSTESNINLMIEALGGIDNINAAGHCLTRLRFILKDETIVDDNRIKQIKGVKGIAKKAGQYQVIIGAEVEDWYKIVNEKFNFKEVDYTGKDNVHITDIIFGTMQKTMFPIFGVLAGSGMITALLSILANTHLISVESPTYVFFNTVAGCAMYALPVLVGYSAAKAMDTDPFVGMLIGCILEYPALSSLITGETGASIFGLSIQSYTYSSTVIPVILAVILVKYVERLCKRCVPKVVQYFVTPMVCILIVVPAVYLVLGPIGNTIAGLLGDFFVWLMNTMGTAAMAFMAPFLTFLVAAGMHMALSPIFRALRAEIGFDPIFSPAFLIFNIGVAGTALAHAISSKDETEKGLGISACISGLCGISEPALYGTILIYKKNLIATLVALALSGAVGGLLSLRNYNNTPNSIFGMFGYGFEGTNNLTAAIISSVVAFVLCFVFNYIANKKGKEKN